MFSEQLGAKVSGAGSDVIVIEGVESPGAACHSIIPDRIAAGTLLVAAAVTGGDVTLTDVVPGHLSVVIAKLREMGAEIETQANSIRTVSPGKNCNRSIK